MLRCRICGDHHKADSKHFAQELRTKDGKIIGYMCNKCFRKSSRAEFIRQNNIQPSGGRRLVDLIRDKIKELIMAGSKT